MKRHKDAIGIQEGACNPSGIAHSIIAACAEMRAQPGHKGTAEICTDPALRLMVHQLAFLFNIGALDSDLGAYGAAMDACRKEVG